PRDLPLLGHTKRTATPVAIPLRSADIGTGGAGSWPGSPASCGPRSRAGPLVTTARAHMGQPRALAARRALAPLALSPVLPPAVASGASWRRTITIAGTAAPDTPPESSWGRPLAATADGKLLVGSGAANGPGVAHLFDPTTGTFLRELASPMGATGWSFST